MDNAIPQTSTSPILTNETNTEGQFNNDLGDHFNSDLVFACQTKPDLDTFAGQTGREFRMPAEQEFVKEDTENFMQIRVDSLMKLKDSTKKLLYLIEDIQVKTHSTTNASPIRTAVSANFPIMHKVTTEIPSKISDFIDGTAIRKLESRAKNLSEMDLEKEDDDCSVFKRLTRRCNCFNRREFNDFMIHFNEDTKYYTSNLGEIIKNLRILKKFLYMGDGYTKNALVFLNEGLTKCPHSEKVDMILAISHADLCNVFDADSFVTSCIMWPCKYEVFGDSMTQSLAARVLYRVAIVEEGRRYLNFNSKISNDIKRIMRKKVPLNPDVLEFLNSTLNLLNPSIVPLINATYYCKADEGMANKILNALIHFRYNMTLAEVKTNLDLLNQMTNVDKGRRELRRYMPHVLRMFRHILVEYDNSEMNEVITNILNNLLTKPTLACDQPKCFVVNNSATEPIGMRNISAQMPSKLKIQVKSRWASGLEKARNNSSRKYEHDIRLFCASDGDWLGNPNSVKGQPSIMVTLNIKISKPRNRFLQKTKEEYKPVFK